MKSDLIREVSIIVFLIIVFNYPSNGQSLDADKVLTAALQYHDPNNEWPSLKVKLWLKESRPEAEDRTTQFMLDNSMGRYGISRKSGETYSIFIDSISGDFNQQQKNRALILRDYYLYLWGLPMKLMDENTPEVTVIRSAADQLIIRIPYEKDTWHFTFNRESGKLLEYKFYQNKEETKGELIKLQGEVAIGGIKIPKIRKWYLLPGMKYLGKDELVNYKPID